MSALRSFLNDVVNAAKETVDVVKKKVVETYDDVKEEVTEIFNPAGKPPTLRLGDKGKDGWVKYLQQLLGVDVDGDFGPKTLEALRAFQEQQQLEANGIAGDQTWAALRGGALETPIQPPISLSGMITSPPLIVPPVVEHGKMNDTAGPLPYLLERQRDLAQASAEAPNDHSITDELNDINRLIADELERLKQKQFVEPEVPDGPADPEEPYGSPDWGDGSPDPPSSDTEEIMPRFSGAGAFFEETDEYGNPIRGPSRTESRDFVDSIVPIAGPAGDAAANFQDMGDAQTDVEALKYGALGLINTAFAIVDVATLGSAAAARAALKKAGIELAYTGGKEASGNVVRVAGEQALIATQGDDLIKAVTPTAPLPKNLAQTLTKAEMERRIARLEKRLSAQNAVSEAHAAAKKALNELNWGLKEVRDADSLVAICDGVRATTQALARAIKEYDEYADALLEFQELQEYQESLSRLRP